MAVTPSGSRPMSASAVSDLPEPDSPISPTRSPRPDRRTTRRGRARPAGPDGQPLDAQRVTRCTLLARSRRPSAVDSLAVIVRSSELRVEAVAQPVAEQVEAEHGERDRQARPERQRAAWRTAAPGTPAASGPTTASAGGCRSRGTTAPPRPGSRWRTTPTPARSAPRRCSAARGARRSRCAAGPPRGRRGRTRWPCTCIVPARATPGEGGTVAMPIAIIAVSVLGPVDGAEHDGEQQRGEGEHEVVGPHDQLGQPAEPAGGHPGEDAERRADHRGDADGHDADEQRGAGARPSAGSRRPGRTCRCRAR